MELQNVYICAINPFTITVVSHFCRANWYTLAKFYHLSRYHCQIWLNSITFRVYICKHIIIRIIYCCNAYDICVLAPVHFMLHNYFFFYKYINMYLYWWWVAQDLFCIFIRSTSALIFYFFFFSLHVLCVYRLVKAFVKQKKANLIYKCSYIVFFILGTNSLTKTMYVFHRKPFF